MTMIQKTILTMRENLTGMGMEICITVITGIPEGLRNGSGSRVPMLMNGNRDFGRTTGRNGHKRDSRNNNG
jgi:hypothetical protein